MKKILLIALVASMPLSVIGQRKTDESNAMNLPDLAAASAAQSQLATEIAQRALTPEEGLARLKENAHLLARDDKAVEQALFFSAGDVGRRLAAAKEIVAAQLFFVEVERALGALIEATSEDQSLVRASYLRERGILRARHLGKPTEGRADLEQAIELQPNDNALKQLLRALPSDPAQARPNAKKA